MVKSTVKEMAKVLKQLRNVCPKCNGTGIVRQRPCDCCGGKGWHSYKEMLKGVECTKD